MPPDNPPTSPPNRGLRLNVELGSQLLLQPEGWEESIKSILVGLEPPAYLIIRVPFFPNRQDPLAETRPLSVRYRSLGNAYGFRSSVLGAVDKPVRLVFLAYPESVESLDIRRHSRVSCYIPATAHVDEREFKGIISDISVMGCRFTLKFPAVLKPQQVQVIDFIRLAFPLLGMPGLQEFYGIVRNTSVERERIGFGIEFDRLDAAVAEKIAAYVERMTEYDGNQPL